MKIQVTGINLNVTDALRDVASKKIKKLDRYFEPDTDVNVVLSVEKACQIVEVTIAFDGAILRGEESTDDMYTSIDNVVKKLEKQIQHHRTRLEKRLRGGAFVDAPLEYGEEPEESLKVVRTKRFAVKPLDIEEAALQMQLLGHDFFVFRNADSGEVNVIYRRKDGKIGLIEPTFE